MSALQRLLGKSAKIAPGEAPAVTAAFLLYFCLFCGYFAVRPVRETVGTVLGAERVSDLFVATWIASIALVPAYGWVCARLRRKVFLPCIYAFIALALALCGVAFLEDEGQLAIGPFFYVLISVLNLFVVSVFWSFLLELFDSEQTKRLFGVIAAGGTTGALTGPALTDLLVGRIGHAGILFLGSGMFILAILCQRLLLRIWVSPGHARSSPPAEDRPLGGNPFAGFRLVLKSPYLLGIATFVILLATVNTFLYLEQLQIVADTFSDRAERTRVFSRLDYIVQSLTVLCQIFLTGRLASKWGVVVLLTAVPLTMVGGFALLASWHSFAALAVVMVARRVGEYALVRPGREMLFSPLDRATKYKAKNLIDVPVYRGGDALAAQVYSGISAAGLSPARIAVLGAVVALAWVGNGWWLGRRREHLRPPATPSSSS